MTIRTYLTNTYNKCVFSVFKIASTFCLVTSCLGLVDTSLGVFDFPMTSFQVLLNVNDDNKKLYWEEKPSDAWIINCEDLSILTNVEQIKPCFALYTNKGQNVSMKRRHGIISGIMAPISMRGSLVRDASCASEQSWIWHIDEYSLTSSSNTRSDDDDDSSTIDPNKEVVCVEGTFGVVQRLRSIQVGTTTTHPMGIVWKPLSGSWTILDVWKLRTLVGCRGIILDDVDMELYRKLKRPCSAMDYPPTIYMIGEDRYLRIVRYVEFI